MANTANAVETKVKETVTKVEESVSNTNSDDNAFDGTSLIGTVIKSIFGGILDFFKGLFGMKKN